MLVEFQRVAVAQQRPEGGEDDGLPTEAQNGQPLPISFNPQFVAAVTPSMETPNATIIKLSDGRGYQVRGNYPEVLDRLMAGGAQRLN